MAKKLTTATVPRRERLAFWNQAVSETFVDLGCAAGAAGDTIEGEIDVRTLGGLQVSTVRATPQLVTRGRSEVASSRRDDGVLVGVQTRGRCVVTQDGRRAEITRGALAAYDTQRPYQLDLTGQLGPARDFEQVVVQFPRALFERIRAPESVTARTVEGGAGRVFLSALASLRDLDDDLDPAVTASMAQGLEHLLLAALTPLDRDGGSSRRRLIEAHLEEHLRDQTLSVASISRALHLSPSSIHRAFADDGETLMTRVWNRRLDGAHRDLTRGPTDVSFTQLAHAWGFASSAHFSRAFKARFGTPPSQLRASPSSPS
ncbi:AraC-like ligand-binding domain-containing protein [Gulosibacter faecalis]|uniref:Helix-turn-helix domain-containing protein n=1 Tax=Gulosibacter faecalis TaxID=272240 RepID=A0ABW5UVT7_9MICO|nr:helix-turn-helix domain-containing protein [Gulosibacter faecalis]